VIVLQIIGWLWLILFGGCCLVMLGTLLYAAWNGGVKQQIFNDYWL